MATDLVAIKIIIHPKIGEGQKGAKYPDLNQIDIAIRKNMGWSVYVDTIGHGLRYDKTENLGLGDATGAAIAFVEEDFAEAAIALFPSTVKILDDAEAQTFWETRACCMQEDEKVNTDVLNGLSAQRALKVAVGQDVTELDVKITKALDPLDTTEKGVEKNDEKAFVDFKVKRKLTLKAGVIPSSARVEVK
jgi:hypothetical protein